jgi:toxin ParE1/3/4
MQIVWSAAAIRDFAAIRDYIAADNPRAAERQIRLILTAIAGLVDFPAIGRPGRVRETRELVVGRTPYLVAYRMREGVIEIARVLHARQRWPDRL